MRAVRTRLTTGLLITSLLVGGAACADDDATSTTEPIASTTTAPTIPTTTAPTTTAPTTTAPTTTAPTVPATTEPSTTPPATTAPAIVDARVYFLDGERLVIEHREVEGPAVLLGALTALMDGPTGDLQTAIPAGTEVRSLNLVDGTATVDLTGEFGSGGGSASMLARVGQVVFTATQFDNVDRVVFRLDGAPIDHLGGEGLVMSEPWTRADVPRDLVD